MNWRLNVIALTIYTLLGVTAGSVVFLTMRQWTRDVAQPHDSMQEQDSDDVAPAAHLDRPIERLPKLESQPPAETRDVRLLRALLDERNEQVRELREKLAASEARVADLRQRYDRMLAMMDEWIEIVDTMDTGSPASDASGASQGDAPAAPPSEGVSNGNAAAQQRAEDLRQELETITLELAMREEQLANVTQELIERRAMQQAMANQLLAPMISTVLPRLEAMLESPQPNVRKWACETLAAIGSPARDAATTLRSLLAIESDQAVRAAAERALDAITD